jgi:hypothetical protein
MSANLEQVMDYIGWGDPFHGLWFVGIEEATTWKCESHIADELAPHSSSMRRDHGVIYRYGPQAGYRPGTSERIAKWEASIANPLSVQKLDFDAYKQRVLWLPHTATFHCNVWPLGKPTVSTWPSHYTKLFGVTMDEWRKTRNELCAPRFTKIQALRQRADVRATVCFGISTPGDFEKCMGLDENSGKETNNRRLRIWEAAKVILAYHWSGPPKNTPLNVSDVAEILEKLHSWGVALP